MKCEDVLRVIEDYHDGEIPHALAGQVEAHLCECPDCAGMLERLRAEDELYRKYATVIEEDLQLGPEVWRGIESRIAAPAPAGSLVEALRRRIASSFPSSPLLRQAVFAAVVAVFSVAVTLVGIRYYGGGRGTPAVIGDSAPEQGGSKNLKDALAMVQRAEQEYLIAIRTLTEIVDKERETLDPRYLAEFEQNLRMIDRNIAATRAAYYKRPSDPELAYYMLSAYGRKVELLQQIAS